MKGGEGVVVSVLTVLARGGIAGAALFGVTVAFLGRASAWVLGSMWVAGIALELAVRHVADRVAVR